MPSRVGKSDQPRSIGMLRNNKTNAAGNFADCDAIRKCAFVVSVGGALPTSDIDNAERTSDKSSDAARDATKDRKQHTQHPNHGNSPVLPTVKCYHRLYRGQ